MKVCGYRGAHRARSPGIRDTPGWTPERCTNRGFVTVRTVSPGRYPRAEAWNRAIVSLCWRLGVGVPVALLRGASTGSLAFRSALSVDGFQGPGNRRPSGRAGHPTARNPPSGENLDRPALPGGGQSALAARTLAVLHCHTGGAASLASASAPHGSRPQPPRAESRRSGQRVDRGRFHRARKSRAHSPTPAARRTAQLLLSRGVISRADNSTARLMNETLRRQEKSESKTRETVHDVTV